MLNFFYMYAGIWGSVLFLYLLGWSGLNSALNPILLVFFLCTIALSLVLGRWFSSRLKFTEGIKPAKMPWVAVILIVACGLYGIAQLGFVPLLEIAHENFDYEDMLNADPNIFRTIGLVGSVFGVGYQFSRLQIERERDDIFKLVLFLVVLVLFASRSPFMIVGITCLILFLARHRRRLSVRQIIGVIVLVLLGLWAFGAFGNIRQGYDWNDSSYIYLLGYFGGQWPDWIPREYCWAYSYLTSPLANVNYSMQFSNPLDPVNFVYDFIPLFLAKRLPLYMSPHAPLVVSYFNVSSVWSNYYLHLSVLGLFVGYVLQMLLLGFWHVIARGTQNVNLMLAYCSECVAMSFFVNSFAYPTMAYPAVLLFVICLAQNSIERRSRRLTVPKAKLSVGAES